MPVNVLKKTKDETEPPKSLSEKRIPALKRTLGNDTVAKTRKNQWLSQQQMFESYPWSNDWRLIASNQLADHRPDIVVAWQENRRYVAAWAAHTTSSDRKRANSGSEPKTAPNDGIFSNRPKGYVFRAVDHWLKSAPQTGPDFQTPRDRPLCLRPQNRRWIFDLRRY